ncbi:molecular chaperone Hsp20 [Aliidongia dinghuensis]|uniref:Molecular chaperone Hsp20 n=1 Tax=Aliidongia dinghuensis TaxID=1867774 RepID=A0A8J2YS39_9PROT|nr:Hsp20/alpha crystallin family protein [Aliidongia dinghuensis]GGF12763.1 molecular chaperone Hsp20 [Aliidongia dinghuensis]
MLLSPSGFLGWDPFAEMRRMQNEVNRLFADMEGRAVSTAYPPVNLWAGEDSVVVTGELPGLDQNDLELAVREGTLTIGGTRKPLENGEGASWHRRERAYGSFSRTIELPFRVDPDKVQARFANGVLEIELQRREADKPRRIQVKSV